MPHPLLIPALETRTLPGWPEVADPGLVGILPYVLGWPVAIAAVFTLVIMGPAWFRRSRRTGSEVERAEGAEGAEA